MIRQSFGDRLFSGVIYVLLTLLAFSTFYPFWNAAVISFNSGADTSLGGITFWPRVFTLENYEIVFNDKRILNAFGVSVLRTIAGTAASILITAVFAYGMSKNHLMGRKFYMVLCIVTMYFSGGLIPSFLLIRSMGMMNTFWVFIIPSLVSVWNMIIFRTFFKEPPAGLEESAQMDGHAATGASSSASFSRCRVP
ncbi:hypothetical protein LJK87_13525 [Paenibacillus sp. P25]|nr:hypothetical protein LJK87_13525 [Paenibacillus sp. P25]